MSTPEGDELYALLQHGMMATFILPKYDEEILPDETMKLTNASMENAHMQVKTKYYKNPFWRFDLLHYFGALNFGVFAC